MKLNLSSNQASHAPFPMTALLSRWPLLALALLAAPLAAQGSLSGVVTDADTGEPLAGAAVQVFTEGGVEPVGGAAAGPDGAYRVARLAAGTYTVTASFLGYAAGTQTVTVGEGQAARLDLALAPDESQLGDVVVSASRRQEKVLDAPASISVLSPREIAETVAPSPVAALRNVTGVDEVQTGVTGRELVLRGFTSAFSGSAFALTDYRQSALPALGANAYALMPIATVDLDRIEVVRGPAATLYGPGVTQGVVHFISRDPFSDPGTTVSAQGGERSLFGGELRHAGVVNDRFGYKVVGTYAQGDDFELDPTRPANAALLGQEVLFRDYGFRKYTVYGSAGYRFAPSTSLTVDAGLSSVNAQFPTDLGTAQADGYQYRYVQARLQAGSLFAQAFVNAGDAGDSFLYGAPADPACTFRVGAPDAPRGDTNADGVCDGQLQVNTSTLTALQAQYALDALFPSTELTVGTDLRFTRPASEGTVYGRFEDEDSVDEYGVYAQSSTALSPKLDVVLGLRGDYQNVSDDVTLSPRVGLVYKATAEHSFRATYNRSVTAPTTNSLFLDLVALNAGGINIRAVGNARGFTYGRNEAFRALAGTDLVATSLLPTSLGQPTAAGADLTELYTLLYGQITGAGPAAVQAALAAQGLPLDLGTVGQLLALLDPALTQVSGFSPGAVGFLNLSDPTQVDFVDPNTLTDLESIDTIKFNTFELGYKGVLGGRFIVGVDAYYERRSDLIAPLALGSPFVFGATAEADLAAALAAGITGNGQLAGALGQFGLTPAQAAALIVGFSQGAFSGPIGIIETDQTRAAPGDTPELFLTFRNAGAISYYGVDLSVEAVVTDRINVFANTSILSKTFFDNEDLGTDDEAFSLAANTPGFKVKAGASYVAPRGLSLNAAVRYADDYRFQSGPYVGVVSSYAVVDVGGGYALDRFAPGLRLDVTVSNLFDNDHVEFIGAADIGRLAVARLTYDF